MEVYASYCYSEVPRTAYIEDNLQNTPNYSNPSMRLLIRVRMIPFLPPLNRLVSHLAAFDLPSNYLDILKSGSWFCVAAIVSKS
jgi:hypothetical protein